MDVSENRLFRWSKPDWLNNSTIRNTGVYTAGALVLPAPYLPRTQLTQPVLPRLLLPRRRSRLLPQLAQRLNRARAIRRLDTGDLLGAGDASDQLDREVEVAGG